MSSEIFRLEEYLSFASFIVAGVDGLEFRCLERRNEVVKLRIIREYVFNLVKISSKYIILYPGGVYTSAIINTVHEYQ